MATPTVQASNITAPPADTTQTTDGIYWTAGDGGQALVWVCEGSAGSLDGQLVDGTPYENNNVFGAGGSSIVEGGRTWWCVGICNNDDQMQDLIFNLTPGTTYRIHVCQANGTIGDSEGEFLDDTATDNPVNFTTASAASGPANIAAINGVAIGSISHINGVAIADISAVNGVE